MYGKRKEELEGYEIYEETIYGRGDTKYSD